MVKNRFPAKKIEIFQNFSNVLLESKGTRNGNGLRARWPKWEEAYQYREKKRTS
jgi:hypothetical protein